MFLVLPVASWVLLFLPAVSLLLSCAAVCRVLVAWFCAGVAKAIAHKCYGLSRFAAPPLFHSWCVFLFSWLYLFPVWWCLVLTIPQGLPAPVCGWSCAVVFMPYACVP